jgi:hypothetical protein
MNEAKTIMKAKVLEYDNGRSLVRLENSPITLEWPAIPTLEVNRHEAAYNLDKNGRHYSTRIIEAGPQVSYAFFNTFINKEHQKLSSNSTVELTSDETDIAFELGTDKEAFFRKMIYNTPSGIKHCFYVGAENKIIVQELDTDKISTADARFINTFEQSVRNQYDTRTFVSK